MKTTIEISDALLAEARKMAASRNTTLSEIVEEGLRAITQARSTNFKLRDRSFGGNGARLKRWEDIRQAIYEGRGE